MSEMSFWRDFSHTVKNALTLWETPSISIGAVRDGKTVLCQGFGQCNIEESLAADEKTLYPIGSCSKSFTAAMAVQLVEEGRLDLDKPVREYYPEVRFYDETVTQNVTMRDLLCHRTGLPRHEYSWYGTDFTREEIVHNIRYLAPNQPFRTRFQYNNQCYILAGKIIERITGKTWEENTEQRLLKPLGMRRSTVFSDQYEAMVNRAAPYAHTDPSGMLTGIKRVPHYRSPAEKDGLGAPYGPAGSVVSCAEDMIAWVNFQMTGKAPDGTQLLSQESLNLLHRPQILLHAPMDMPQPEVSFNSYALGWFVESYRGHTMVEHGGNIDGFSAYTCMIPDIGVGFTACVNMEGNRLAYALAREVMDFYLVEESGNWVTRYHEGMAARFEGDPEEDMLPFRGERNAEIRPAHPLCDYAGRYHADGYQDFWIEEHPDGLTASFLGAKAPLRPYRGETFTPEGEFGQLPYMTPLHFRTGDISGAVEGFKIPLVVEEGGAPIFFRKITN